MVFDMEEKFEKLWLELGEMKLSGKGLIVIANMPSDPSLCSIIASNETENKQNFVRLQMNREQTVLVRDALQKVINDMPHT